MTELTMLPRTLPFPKFGLSNKISMINNRQTEIIINRSKVQKRDYIESLPNQGHSLLTTEKRQPDGKIEPE